ncbi:MAG TPA: hypothetical protein VMM56_16860 [Planctomycetaceae bacterium]|nr:hypothetical protein [Planctomycetaceae bacterium]
MSGDKLKPFFVNHVEKIGFVIFALLTLFILSGTRWSRYDRSPVELSNAAKEAATRIEQSQWPESERTALLDWPDIQQRGRMMLAGIPAKNFQYTTLMHHPVYPPHVPIQQPKLFTVDELIADAGAFLMQLPPKEEEKDETEDPEKGTKKKVDPADDDTPDQFKTRPRVAAADSELGTIPGALGGLSSGEYAPELSSELYGEMGMLGGEYGATTKVSLNGVGHRYAVIRGVLDWQGLRMNFAKALNVPLEQADRIEPELMDFEIRRQEAISADSPWDGEWIVLDYQHSIDVLKSAIDMEADPVDVSVTDPAITEPLPRRVYGIWGEHATHPKISQFVLSPEEQAREELRISKIIEAHEKAKKEQGYVEPEKKGGFNDLQFNVRSMQNEMSMPGYGGGEDYMSEYNTDYNNELTSMGMSSAGAGGTNSFLSSARSAAAGRLMLFRYFDFDVEPGRVYRYQVRIKYKNPNFGKPIELLASPELADAQSLFSDWSEPTPPVAIRPKAKYYLTKVDYDSARAEYVANLSVYQWQQETGTIVSQTLQTEVGDQIGAQFKAKVVNPLEETYESASVSIATGDYLVDLFPSSELKVASSLPDLGKVPSVALHDTTVVLNNQGNLKSLDPLSRDADRRDEAKMLRLQNEILGKSYEEKAKKADELLQLGEGSMSMGEEGYGGGRARSSSSSRRRRQSGSGEGASP